MVKCRILRKGYNMEYSPEKIVNDLYYKYSSEELLNIENSDRYSQETKCKYKENIKMTLKNILYMLTDFLIEAYVESIRTKTFSTHTEYIMVYEHIKSINYNIIITEITIDSDENILYKISKNTDFDKFINTDDRCVVLLYFPEEQSYERLIYDSVEKPSDSLQENLDFGINHANKQYPYRYYTFPYQHEVIQRLVQSF